jgi:hypothetical protein
VWLTGLPGAGKTTVANQLARLLTHRGVASGFKHVDKVHTTRLLHCKGKREVRVKLVPLSASSLNAGDVFVLDLGKKIIQWNGSEANKKEKVKALEVCEAINGDERVGKATIEACEQGSEPAEFWAALGGQGQWHLPPAATPGPCRPPSLPFPPAAGGAGAGGGCGAAWPRCACWCWMWMGCSPMAAFGTAPRGRCSSALTCAMGWGSVCSSRPAWRWPS